MKKGTIVIAEENYGERLKMTGCDDDNRERLVSFLNGETTVVLDLGALDVLRNSGPRTWRCEHLCTHSIKIPSLLSIFEKISDYYSIFFSTMRYCEHLPVDVWI